LPAVVQVLVDQTVDVAQMGVLNLMTSLKLMLRQGYENRSNCYYSHGVIILFFSRTYAGKRDKCFDTQEKSVPHNKVQKTHDES
jgi:hypothetical protein